MDAIKFILKEHAKIKSTFNKIKSASRSFSSKQKMFDNLCNYLKMHESMEEKVWYPKLKLNAPLKKVIKHLISEEKKAAKVIKSFKKVKTQKAWEKKFAEFNKAVLHHASCEQKKLFPKVRKAVEKSELEKLGKRMMKFKQAHLKKKK